MKFCADHWSRLRKAIDDRGLSALVAETGEQAVKNLASELEGGAGVDNFDPLMGAHNAIMGNALSVAGLAIFATKDDGSEWCPLCFLLEVVVPAHDRLCVDPECPGATDYEGWINIAADEQVAAWKALRP